MNRVFRSIWNHVSQTFVAASELAKARGKGKGQRGKRSRLVVAAAVTVLAPTLISQAFAQQCSLTASGGTVSGTTANNGCTISAAGSTVNITGTGNYQGWMNFTGLNASLVIGAGGQFNSSEAVGGNSTFSFLTASASGWSLTNNGQISTSFDSPLDLIGVRAAGNYSITNNGSIINLSTTVGSNAIESSLAGAVVQITNSGYINGGSNQAINLSGNGTYTVRNLASGQITSTATNVFSAVAGTLDMVNMGIIQAQTGGTAISSAATATLRNIGTITSINAANRAVVFGTNDDTLILEPSSIITGYATAGGGTDTLVLGGTGTGSFDLGAVGDAQQYRLFEVFEKREAGTWALTGSSDFQVQNWRVLEGTLQLASGASLQAGSTIQSVATATAPVNIRISGALVGSGVGISLESPLLTNTLVLDAGASFGSRTLNVLGGATTLTGAAVFPNGVTIGGGAVLQVGNGGAGTGGNLSGNVANSGGLYFNRADDTTYSGIISGTGIARKLGPGTLTLTGNNTYTGATDIAAGTLQIGNGGTTGGVVGNITNSGALVFNRSNALGYAGTISGTGSLTQAGTGTTTLTGTGSSVGAVNVTAGTLALAQAGAFTTTGAYTTAAGAGTSIAANTTLAVGGAFTQVAGSRLDIALGSTQPVISASTANLGGTLNITGFSAAAPTTASALGAAQFKLIHTTGGIANGFAAVSLGSATSPVDYLTLAAGKSADGFDYNVGFGLTWLAGATLGNGVFTLAGAADTFNVDVALGNQAASATGWDGTTLTKNGAGTLLLSAVNGYTGPTLVNAGTLQTGIADAFASSGAVNVASGATLDLNNFNQTANNLTGAGGVTLGSAALTANNTSDTTFGGTVSGGGGLVKTGTATLTLTGDNSYTGGTTISAGTLQIGNGGTTGSIAGNITDNGALVFNRSNGLDYAGTISGTGSLTQAGTGTTTLTGTGSSVGG
jgi:autotransporter-associated beta strand protein